MQNLLIKTKTGIIWSFVSQGGNQILSLSVTFILARLISPEQFGTIGMVAVFSSFAKIFVDFGFSSALIQKKNASQKDINTVFCINLSLGFILSILFFISAPLIAGFYEKTEITSLTRALSPIFLISSVTGVNRAMTIKNLNIKLNTVIALIATLVSSVTAIIMAFYNFGEWSILTKMLVDATVLSLLYLSLNPVNQKLSFSKNSFKNLFKFGSNVAGDATINYWSRNADNLLIGKFLGDSSLGLYTKAYAIMMLPLKNISRVISKVMFPSFSILQNDISQIRIIYLKTTKLIAYVTFPLMAGLSISAKYFVLVAFGKDWVEMIPIISILSILGAIQSILSLNGVIYNALGKAGIAFKVSIVMSILYILSFILGIVLGDLMGLVIAYTITGLIASFPNFYMAGKQINITIKEMLINLTNPFLATGIMSIFLYLVKLLIIIPSNLPSIISLLILIAIGCVVYFLTSKIFKFEELESIKKIIKN